MGKLLNGLFGGFHGKVGNLVGYTLKGKYVIRTIGRSSKPLTPARKANCQKMTVVNEILSPSIEAIRMGFHLAVDGTDRNEYNEAVSYNKKNALQGVYPNVSLDYDKVLMSMGSLPVAVNSSISQNEKKITFNWEVTDSPTSEYASDRTMIVVYFPNLKVSFCQLSGAKRIEGKDVVTISSEHINERMEAYISFVKDNGRAVSNSVHVGSLNLDCKVEIADDRTSEIKDVPEFVHLLQDELSEKVNGECELKLSQNDACIAELRINSSSNEQADIKEPLSSTLLLLFRKTKINQVILRVNIEHKEMVSLSKDLGFKMEGNIIDNQFVNGKLINECRFTVLKSEWDLLN